MSTKYLVNNQGLSNTGDTQVVNTWVNPNNNEWQIVTYNNHAVIEYDGITPSIWFPFSGVPLSNGTSNCYGNNLRGGIIEFTGYVVGGGYGSMFGQINFSRNCSTLFDPWIMDQTSGGVVINGDWDGFIVSTQTNTPINMFFQWTARLHYTVENVC